MKSEFAEILENAIEQGKENAKNERKNIKNYTWKGPKVKLEDGSIEQLSVKLIDATEEQLNDFYKHCNTMLYNTDPKNLGRVPLLKSLQEVRDKCGVELFYRDSEVKKSTRFTIVNALNSAIANNNLSPIQVNYLTLGHLLTTQKEFNDLPINLVIDGGLDKLGRFDASHMTFNFLLRQGIWLATGEKKDCITLAKDDKIAKIKAALKLKPTANLELNPITGLSIAEMKIALDIRDRKYSEIPTEQLRLIREKLTFALEDDIKIHISQWENRKMQIEEVAELKGISLNA